MKTIKTYEPSTEGGPDTGYWPVMEECPNRDGEWVSLEDYEKLEAENKRLKEAGGRTMALENHVRALEKHVSAQDAHISNLERAVKYGLK